MFVQSAAKILTIRPSAASTSATGVSYIVSTTGSEVVKRLVSAETGQSRT
jgi:hypothetical protein